MIVLKTSRLKRTASVNEDMPGADRSSRRDGSVRKELPTKHESTWVYRCIENITGVVVKPSDRDVLRKLCLALTFLMAANAVLSPLRDSLVSMNSKEIASRLISTSTIAMVCINPIATWVALSRDTATLVQFYLRGAALVCSLFAGLFFWLPSVPRLNFYVSSSFFIFHSLLSVLTVSAVWGGCGECLDLKVSNKAYFALLSLTATVGHILGSALTAHFASVGKVGVISFAALLFELSYQSFSGAEKRNPTEKQSQLSPGKKKRKAPPQGDMHDSTNLASPATDGKPWFMSLYAQVILVYSCCYSIALTVLYMERMSISSNFSVIEKTAIFADINFWASCLTLLLQIFVSGRALQVFSTTTCLIILPLGFGMGFWAIFYHNTIGALYFIEFLRRSLAFAVVKPTRELLYIAQPRHHRTSTKTFNDSICRKAGDISAPLYASLVIGSRYQCVGSIIFVWILVALYLGRQFDLRVGEK